MFSSVIEAVFYHAEKTPDKLALADDASEVVYSQYRDLIRSYAMTLRDLGIQKGDKVVLEAEQTIRYLALELAIHLLGAVFVPLEHNCAASKLEDIAVATDAKLIISDRCVETNRRICSYTSLEAALAEQMLSYTMPEGQEISEILFSTGTTGKEKGIVLTHENDCKLAENVMYGVEMEQDNVELIPSPMNHSHGLRRYYANMFKGATVILLGSAMNMKRLFFCLEHYHVNSMDLVPAAMAVILRLSRGKLSAYREQLRYIQFGAAPMSDDDKMAICQQLPTTRMYNFYGSTESGCTFIYNFNVPNPKQNCVGRPTWNTEALLTSEDGKRDDGPSGLLATKGGMNMLGYWRDPEETEKALRDGVVYSSDIAYFDPDGDLILMGRKGDVINVGGNKVSPDEIENAAKRMGCISDCGCVPAEDKARGQVPKLFVQLKSGCDFDPVAIRAFLSENLEPFKVPAYIEQIDRIPRSFNGKLLRKELINR